MRIRSEFIGFVLMLLALVVTFPGCQPDEEESTNKSKKAELIGFRIGSIQAPRIPEKIAGYEWDDESNFNFNNDLTADHTVEIFFNAHNEFNEDAIVTISASPGAKKEFAITSNTSARPVMEDFQNSRTASFTVNYFVYVKITSEDGKEVNYYRFRIRMKNASTVINSVSVAGVNTILAASSESWGTAPAGKVSIPTGLLNDAKIVVAKGDPNMTVRFAKTSGNEVPQFGDNDTFTFADGDTIYIEATAQNNSVRYYKIDVENGRVNTLESIKIGNSVVIIAANGENWTSITATTVNISVQENYTIIATPTAASGAAVSYAKYSAETGTPPTFSDANIFDLAQDDYIAVKVVSEIGLTRYFKLRMNISVTNIIEQPKAGFYHVGDTPEPLTIITQGGTGLTYQWYSGTPYTTTIGAPISGATSASYTPSTDAVLQYGTVYYWVEIEGTSGAPVVSNRVPFNVVAAGTPKDVLVDLSGLTVRNAEVFTGQYQGFTIDLPSSCYPADFDITNYSRFTVSVNFYSSSGVRIPVTGYGQGGLEFKNESSVIILERYNLGTSETINSSLYKTNAESTPNNTWLNETPSFIYLSTMLDGQHSNFAAYIELVEIRFSGPSRP